jgi:hypothetical protein
LAGSLPAVSTNPWRCCSNFRAFYNDCVHFMNEIVIKSRQSITETPMLGRDVGATPLWSGYMVVTPERWGNIDKFPGI